jgi:uncharacterized integral membrane protein
MDGTDSSSLTRSDQPNETLELIPQYESPKAKPAKPTTRQPLAWTGAALTLLLLVLTLFHCSQSPLQAHFHFLYSSSSRTIFVLSLLSGLTGLLLTATMSAALDNAKWTLVSRRNGAKLSRLLALQPSTGALGLLRLALGPGARPLSPVRAWAALRLAALLLVPVLGVLIMSNVNTYQAFTERAGGPVARGWGVGRFDAALTRNVSLVADRLLESELSRFLSEPSRAVDETPAADRLVACAHRPGVANVANCRRVFFVPGGLELADVPAAAADSGAVEAYVARGQQGSVLDFVEGPGVGQEWDYDVGSECAVYGFQFAAFELCMWNAAPNVIQAVIVQCPLNVSSARACLDDTDWQKNPGWTTQLTNSFRRATVAYDATNGTILSYQYTKDASPAPISADEIREGFQVIFPIFPDISSLTSLVTKPESTSLFPLYAMPAIIWSDLNGVAALSSTNPALLSRAQDTLQCLLAMMLYFSQPTVFALKLIGNDSLTPELLAFRDTLPTADTEVREARMQFQLVVDRPRLVVYASLCATALLACVAGLALGTFGFGVPETTAFPGWDEQVRCRIARLEEVESQKADTGAVIRLAERLRVYMVA